MLHIRNKISYVVSYALCLSYSFHLYLILYNCFSKTIDQIYYLLSILEAAKFPKKVDSPLAPSPSPRILECRKSTFGNICSPRTEREILSSPNLKAFSYNELKNATRNFRHDFLLGEGGFGHVYKGWIDSSTLSSSTSGSRIAVAIKKLKAKGFQGHNEWLVRS